MKTFLLLYSFLIVWTEARLQIQAGGVAHGQLLRYADFPSRFLRSRHVDVWLPPGYDSTKRYAVLYMHDGQMLFDSSGTWNGQEWGVDETISRLQQERNIRPTIVVAIWNTGNTRRAEYFPERALLFLEPTERDSMLRNQLNGKAEADAYLRFLVTELKPFIDRRFATDSSRSATCIAGSSMGGLISLYALCEYPGIFGGAACLSTHWPGQVPVGNSKIPEAILKYLETYLPPPAQHRIYFDYGTETLDKYYPPWQEKADKILRTKGYNARNWRTMAFPGADHSEKAWRQRLSLPLRYLLGPTPHIVTVAMDKSTVEPGDSVLYLAATINGWNPADINYRFHSESGRYILRFPYQSPEALQYKVTRGDWLKSEADADGYPKSNHVVSIHSDTTLLMHVPYWADRMKKKSTAGRSVEILDSAFPSFKLGNKRRVWVYLPPSYHKHRKKYYPVIYLQDGQNLFDRAVSFAGQEWRVDETLDSIAAAGGNEYIAVGIASGSERLREYLAWPSRHIPQEKGSDYMDFLVQELMPYINRKFRTKTGPADNVIGGSSMGAMIALYGALRHPDVFGSAALFSASYWILDNLKDVVPSGGSACRGSYFLYAGGREMDSLEQLTREMQERLKNCGAQRSDIIFDPDGQHTEQSWQNPFVAFVNWLHK